MVDQATLTMILSIAGTLLAVLAHWRQGIKLTPAPNPAPIPQPGPGPVSPHLGDGHILAVLLQLLAQLQQPGGPLSPPAPKV